MLHFLIPRVLIERTFDTGKISPLRIQRHFVTGEMWQDLPILVGDTQSRSSYLVCPLLEWGDFPT